MENSLAMAYSEVEKILSFMEKKYVEKIPREIKELFEKEKLKGYFPDLDMDLPLEKQHLQRKTFAILAMLNLDYWCESEEEKQKLLKIYTENGIKKEEELKKKYNVDTIFYKKELAESSKKYEKQVNLAVCKKQNFFITILKKIEKFFERKENQNGRRKIQ